MDETNRRVEERLKKRGRKDRYSERMFLLFGSNTTMKHDVSQVKTCKVLRVHSFSLPFRRRGVMMRMPGTHLQTLHHLAQRKTN